MYKQHILYSRLKAKTNVIFDRQFDVVLCETLDTF